jgi:hypothetical protein
MKSDKGKGRPERELRALMLIDQLAAWDMVDWTEVLDGVTLAGFDVYELKLKRFESQDAKLLLVMKAYDVDGRPVVAFHAGNNVLDVLAGAMRRLRNGSLKWKEDQYHA